MYLNYFRFTFILIAIDKCILMTSSICRPQIIVYVNCKVIIIVKKIILNVLIFLQIIMNYESLLSHFDSKVISKKVLFTQNYKHRYYKTHTIIIRAYKTHR